MLVAPVGLEVFDARPRLAMDEDHQMNSICAILGQGGQWLGVIVYVQVVIQVIQIRRECEVQSEIKIVMQDGQDGSRYPSLLIGLRWLNQGFT